MIQVLWEEREDRLTLQVTGHAGSAPAGQDLICAGMTTLVYALAQTLQSSGERLAEEPDIQLSPGFALIRAKAKPETLRGAFQMAINGAKLLATHYPECVAVSQSKENHACIKGINNLSGFFSCLQKEPRGLRA
jgi:uncharacterized protein YsxB (DUF464 family)